jgi:hypothetical protein
MERDLVVRGAQTLNDYADVLSDHFDEPAVLDVGAHRSADSRPAGSAR